MKKNCLYFVIVLFLTIGAKAASLPANGQIITATDTVDVVFSIPIHKKKDIPDYEKLQEKITYLDANKKKVAIRPTEAKEVRFVFRSQKIRMISRVNNLMLGSLMTMESSIFLKLEIDGALKLFSYYDTKHQSTGGGYNAATGMPGPMYTTVLYVKKSVYQKGDGNLMMPDGITFKSDMKKYLEDCPLLVSKLENKEL